MKQMIKGIAQALVDNPDQVEVNEIQTGQVLVFELRVAPTDQGQVIGRQGRTASAMRLLLGAAASKAGKRSVLEITENA